MARKTKKEIVALYNATFSEYEKGLLAEHIVDECVWDIDAEYRDANNIGGYNAQQRVGSYDGVLSFLKNAVAKYYKER
jgi:hypothetical protein